ncbi:MAG: putative lipid II flippase FtsW [Endomicrobiales bacterium]|nr:putative lipid II flippase FtsW [Endomicrobiales bacterium]
MKQIKYLTKLLNSYNKTNKPLSGPGFLLQISVFLLVAIGTLMVFSSSVDMSLERYHSAYYIFYKQLMWLGIGTLSFLFFYKWVDYRLLQKYAKPILFVSVVFLMVVLVFDSHHNVKRWLNLGPFSFQPSEFAKLAIIIALADFIDRKKSKLNKLSSIMPLGLIVLLPLALVFLEKDLGTPILIAIVALSMLLAGGLSWLIVSSMGIFVVLSGIFAVLIQPYRLKRIRDFAQSFFSIDSTSYQVNHSNWAFGSGGLFGKGPGNSEMKDLWLPESHTDFIFPIIGEEFGFIGAIGILILYIMFFVSGWAISKRSDTYFGSMVAFGITILIAYQALINMGVATALLPTKGLALPFISYGGSSLVVNMIAAGILLNIAKNGK